MILSCSSSPLCPVNSIIAQMHNRIATHETNVTHPWKHSTSRLASNIINVNLLVVTAILISILVKLDVVINAFVSISEAELVPSAIHDTRPHTYPSH